MKKLIALLLIASAAGSSIHAGGVLGGLGNLVSDAGQIITDGVDTGVSALSLGNYNETHLVPRAYDSGYDNYYGPVYDY